MSDVLSFRSSDGPGFGHAKPGTEQLRRQNLILVLSALRQSGPLSHTDISAATGLASATVTAVTADLERVGAIERMEQTATGGRGRPRVLFARRRTFAHAAIVQISSDVVQYGLADYCGRLIDRISSRRDLAAGSAENLLQDISFAVARLLQRSKLSAGDLGALSISSKGIIDSHGSRLVWSAVLENRQVDFNQLLNDFPSADLFVSNETLLVAHALAKRSFLPSDGATQSLIALSLGHSIGLGIARMEGGALSVSAPNFGHMLNAPEDKLCRCGSRGCVEASAGFYAILRTAFQVPPMTIPAKFVPLPEMEKLAISARQGNRMAQYAFRQAGLALGQGLSRVLSLNETMPVVLTGLGTRFYDLMTAGMEEGLRQSLHIRLNGLPQITIGEDETELAFDGHLDRTLAAIDQRAAMR
ncbi:ROK family protein [Rhizobium oryzicola]|uniref:ROK family protein n=1 Tax=Rhizobium oryzicola TaxID=1232668 RepID=UPI003F5294B4